MKNSTNYSMLGIAKIFACIIGMATAICMSFYMGQNNGHRRGEIETIKSILEHNGVALAFCSEVLSKSANGQLLSAEQLMERIHSLAYWVCADRIILENYLDIKDASLAEERFRDRMSLSRTMKNIPDHILSKSSNLKDGDPFNVLKQDCKFLLADFTKRIPSSYDEIRSRETAPTKSAQ
jgi:hypothetical protein